MREQLPWEERDDVHEVTIIDRSTRHDTKPRNRVTKCEFTAPFATLGWPYGRPAEGNARPAGVPRLRSSPYMSRRPLVLLALAISSFVLAACSDITGPQPTKPNSAMCSGYGSPSGEC
jgi:hypothetical protein